MGWRLLRVPGARLHDDAQQQVRSAAARIHRRGGSLSRKTSAYLALGPHVPPPLTFCEQGLLKALLGWEIVD